MALPAGALKATVTVGAPIDISGAAGTLVSLHVRPDVPAGLVWAADGTPIEPWSASPAAGESPVTSASLEVLADQPGVLTSSTVDGSARMVEIRSWPLVATWVTRQSATGAPTRHVRRFAAPAPGTTVDLDMLPAGGVTAPATVTYAQSINIGAGSETPLAHKATHATGGTDALTPADIGAQPAGSYAPALGADDNYVTDAEKAALHAHSNKVALDAVSGTNTGDQDLSGLVPKTTTVAGKALTSNITLAAADLTDFTEASQDVVGAMVAAAGGTYDDAGGSITLPTGGGGGSSAQVDIYYATGAAGSQSTYTWTKPAGAKKVEVFTVGAGGGGGSGRRGAAGTVRCGGGGGAAGQWAWKTYAADMLPSTVTVKVAKGGAGGAAVTTDDTNGNPGGGGGGQIQMPIGFGIILYQNGGGAGGSASSGIGGGGVGYGLITLNAPGGGSASTSGASGGGGGGDPTPACSTGGGAGGGITTANAASAGGPGGRSVPQGQSATGGAAGGGVGGDGISWGNFASGAGGGGSSTTGPGGAGGTGGFPGGGGGGGGASSNGYPSGAGGNGGDGIVIVTTYF